MRRTLAELIAQHVGENGIEENNNEQDEDEIARLPVADHVPAEDFLTLVHSLQMNFSPLTWQIEGIELLRAPENDLRWEVVELFKG